MMDFNKVRMTEMEQEQNAERNGVGMKQMMKVFESQEFGKIRIIQEGDHYLFCGVDVASALGYSNPRDALRRHCKGDGVVKRDGVSTTINQHGKATVQTNQMIFITEGNVYRLIAHSKLPSAERFESWVFDEVIPSIRKHGAYMTGDTLERFVEQPDLILIMAQQMLNERASRQEAEAKLKTAQPKADYFDQFVNADDTTNIRNTGKELGIPQNRLITFLLAHHYLYREKRLDGKLMPIAHMNRGYFIVKDVYTPARKLTQQTFMTCKGKEHFRKKIAQILEETA